MKKLLYILSLAFLIMSCQKEQKNKDYVSLSGKITNLTKDSITILSPTNRDFKKIISTKDGSFSDTLKIETGEYVVFVNDKYLPMYLKNGFDINITLDANKYLETIKYSGKGSEASNYIAKTAQMSQEVFSEDIFKLEPDVFEDKITRYNNEILALLEKTPNLDSTFVEKQKLGIQQSDQGLKNLYNQKRAMLAGLKVGSPSPKFSNYENYAGGETSLDDLKGKYVYIDLWATWCGPCKVQIPFLKEIEKEYHGKNIAFVSISVDKPSDYEKWKKMVKDKELSGIQLYAKGDENFMIDYKVQGIPRFILIDPKGNIVDADAPRPSDAKLKDLLNKLSI